jgi:UDP-GlcNAc:undecaprenyl-phosphate GlcNAc-1-phosphate transferase
MMAALQVLTAFLVSTAVLSALYPLAARLGLLDHPVERRKSHRDPVPPIGGIAIFAGILVAALFVLPDDPAVTYGALGASLLVLVGVSDDRFRIGPNLRLVVQICAALLLTLGSGVTLPGLGDLLGFGPIGLGPLAVPFTVFAIVGIVNAFNMIDGIDGLAGGLSLITFGALLFLAPTIGPAQVMMLTVIAALIPYLICNLELFGLNGRKVFLGDAGSMLLGYTVVWALIDSVGSQRSIDPVTALWITAIPLMDTLSVIGRRISHRTSPFRGDRAHLHHLLSRIFGSTRIALAVMLSVAGVLAAVGVLGFAHQVDTPVMFYSGMLIFVAYLVFLRHVRRLHRSIQRRRRRLVVEAA